MNRNTTDFKKIKSLTTFQENYQFFDSSVTIKTNVRDMLEDFDKIYWRFRSGVHPSNSSQELYLFKDENQLILIHQEEYQKLENQTVTPNLYLFIFSYILPQVRSHFLIHAATVSYQDEATVITAHSTSGKTTLAVELVKRGISFLSDELAPINRKTHLIDPFPRSIGLRDLKLHQLECLDHGRTHRSPNAKGEIKWMIDPEDLKAGSVGQASRLKNVIFIEPQYEELSKPGDGEILEICLTKLSESLLLALRRIKGVLTLEVIHDRMFPMIRMEYKAEDSILQEVEESAKVYDSALVSVVHGRTKKPDFNLPPILKPISKFEGTFELAKMVLNAYPQTALMEDYEQKPARLLNELADITPSVHFYRLMVGRLDLMTHRVENLIKTNYGN